MKERKTYDEAFKKSIVEMNSNGKSLSALSKEYGVGMSALVRWKQQYALVKLDDSTTMTSKEVQKLLKEKAALEEENIILKKAIAIFTPHSIKD